MARNIFTLFFFSLIAETVLFLTNAVEVHRQAFIQTDNELRYLVDGISLHLHESLGNDREFTIPNANEMAAAQSYSSPIVLFPEILDFKENPIGMPRLARVIVSNPSYHVNIFLRSISGTSVNFHCSFFQDKVISPGGNTTFDVVFLSRHEGAVHNTLYIHTSVGSFKYQVQGIGAPNPYRLRPFLGAKVPVNSIYSPVISMYNPHSSTLQITEMYSSGGDLHLELPTGEKEAGRQLWEIAPYETKPVMKANFLAREANNHTAYIRIKTNTTNNDYLVLPVEVEVSSASGIYSITDSLDFGVMYSKDSPKSLVLSLLNHSQKHVLISSVSASPYNKAVTVDFNPLKILSNTGVAVQVAAITFNPKLAVDAKSCSGNIIVRTKSSQFKLAIKYQATVLQGSLEYNSSNLEFYVGDAIGSNSELQKNITLKNTFNVSVVIFDAVLSDEAKNHFNVVLNSGVVLHPNQTVTVGYVTLKKCKDVAVLNTFLKLRTNISDFETPLLCYNGKLTPYVPIAKNLSMTRLDVGTLSLGEKRDVLIAVINGNPVNVHLKRFGASLIHVVVELLAVHNKNISELMDRTSFNEMTKTLVLAPQHFAIFRVGITAPNIEESFQGEVFVETLFETLRIPISFKTATGALSVVPSHFVFQPAFPGKISIVNLYIQSTFLNPMTVTAVTTVRDDSRFTYVSIKDSPVLQPNAKTMVGWLQFDVRKDCENNCYLGFDTGSSIGNRWLSSFKLKYGVASVDIDLHQDLWQKWANISAIKRHNVTFVLDTTDVRGFLFQSVVSLVWPRLSTKSQLSFPLTQIGNHTVEELILENTANVPVVVQVVPLFAYPHPSAVINSLQSSLEGLPDLLTYNESAFRLHNNHTYNRLQLPFFLQSQSHPEGLVMFLEPGEKVRIPIVFTPTNEAEASTFLLIRNNLTVLEAVYLRGSGAHCEMRFGSRAPGSSIPLLFELTEKHLKDCENSPFPHYALPNFAVRRAFTIRNTGLLPIYVSGFGISSTVCEGYGFRVLNCHGFILSPNSSKKIDIAFTPDFTLARVQRDLIIHTSMGSNGQTLNFVLLATIPPYLLSRCASILPRPQWEVMLYYVAVCLMLFVLFCVLVTAYLESDRIIRCTFVAMTVTAIPDINKSSFPTEIEAFDLKRIAAKGSTTGGGRSQMVEQSTQSTNSNVRTDNCRGRKSGFSNRINNTCDNLNLIRSQNFHSLLRRVSSDGLGKSGDRKAKDASCLSEFGLGSKKPVKLKKLVKAQSLSEQGSTNANSSIQSSNLNKAYKRNRKYSHENGDYTINQDDKSSSSCSSTNSENDKSVTTTSKSKEELCPSRCSKEKCTKTEKHTIPRLTNQPSKKKSVSDATEEDTSSTTTESSSPDFDSSEKEPRNGTKRWHNKDKKNTNFCETKAADADDDDTGNGIWMQQTSEHRNAHRSRISSPVVELPYKLNACRTANNRPWLYWDDKEERRKSKIRPHKKAGNSDGSTKMVHDCESSSTGKDSPPPLWDQANPTSNIDDAYEKLAKTTESFALRRKGYLNSDKLKKGNYQEKKFKINRDKEKEETTEFMEKKLFAYEKPLPEPKKRTKEEKLPRVIGVVGQRPSSTLSLSVKTDNWSIGGCTEATSPIMGTPCTPPEYQNFSAQPLVDYEQILSRPQTSSSGYGNQWRPPTTNVQVNPLIDTHPREIGNETAGWSSFNDNYLWNNEFVSDSVWSPLHGYDAPNEVGPVGGTFDVGIWNNSFESLNPVGWPTINQWSNSPLVNNNSIGMPQVNNDQETLVTTSEYNPFNTLPTIWTPANSVGPVRNDEWRNSLFLPNTSCHNSENNKH